MADKLLPGALLGYRKNGLPIYLVGGAEDAPPADPPVDSPKLDEPPADPPKAANEPDDLGDKGKKAIDREREARKAAEKAQKAAEARVQEFEDRDKTDLQRLTDENAGLKTTNTAAERENLKLRLALEHKLGLDDLDLLHGDTEEDLTARAKRISELKTAATAAKGPGSADQGAKPPANTDLPSQIKAAENKGDFATAMSLKNQQVYASITKT